MITKTLTNGIRIVAEQIPHVRSIALGIWIGAGSERESSSINGISHFMEHMLFKGTTTRTAKQIAEGFDQFGGQVNAFTSKEVTCYYAKVLDQHFEMSLDLLADMFFHSTFDEQEMEKEKKVVLEEIAMVEDTPDDLIHDLLSEISFSTHPLGNPVIGTKENVSSFTRDQLIAYREQYYNPHNVVIALAGNLPDDFILQVEKYFSHHRGESVASDSSFPAFTPQVIAKQKTTEQSHLCIGFQGLSVKDAQIYPLILLNNILGGNMSSRLFQEVREARGLAYSVYSYHSSHRHNGLFAIYAGTKHGQEQEVCNVIADVLHQVTVQGVLEEELRKAQEQLKGSMMLGLESTNNRMSRLGRNELLLEKHLTLDEIIAQVEQVTLDSVNKLANKIFHSEKSLAIISPDGKLPIIS
ncbi:insulinase family protein [Shimazuella sp. AN120528]|uniref:M16 family metallopeptidase n=1 Tax=Shimazuella soli TaxID=1892854 RepID=UPI001F0D047D|nr:insulinase family protein [Shimazuella soli]